MSTNQPTPTTNERTTKRLDAARAAVEYPEKRAILRVLLREDSATYDRLQSEMDVCHRTVRQHVSELIEDRILARFGSPATVVFPGTDARRPARRALDAYDADDADTEGDA